jgi:hypothetical protein
VFDQLDKEAKLVRGSSPPLLVSVLDGALSLTRSPSGQDCLGMAGRSKQMEAEKRSEANNQELDLRARHKPLQIHSDLKRFFWLGLGIVALIVLIVLAVQFMQSSTLVIGTAALILLIAYILALLVAQRKVIILILISFPLLGDVLYNAAFLNLTLKTGIPAGSLFDLAVVGAFLAWTLKKMAIKGTVRENVHKLGLASDLDWLMVLFLLFIVFQYMRGLMLRNAGIFSEGRGFIYYFLFFPVVDAINIKHIQFEKLNRGICFVAFVYLGLFLTATQGLLLPFDVRFVEHSRGFTFLESGLTRTSLIGASISMVLFPLSLFLFVSSETKTGRRCALMTMLISLFINIRGNTRGYQLGLLVGLCVSLILMGRRYRHYLLRYLPVLLLLLVIGSGMYVSFYGDQAQMLLSRWQVSVHNDPNVIARIIQVKAFGAAFLEQPFIGNNLGTTQTYFAPTGYGIKEFTEAGPHTEVVYWLYTLGLVGTGLFGIILLLVAKMGLSNARSSVLSNQARAVQKAILAILATFFVVSFSSWQFRSWAMVPVIVAMFAYTRNLYSCSSSLRNGKCVVRGTND